MANKRDRSIAVVGIAATAIVGVAGVLGSWLTARDDRATQRSLAHDARVYDRRADTYLAALNLVERQRDQISSASDSPKLATHPPSLLMSEPGEGIVSARLLAYGSPDVVTKYLTLRGIVSSLETERIAAIATDLAHASPAKRAAALSALYRRKLDALQDKEIEFAFLIHRELD